MNVSIHLNPSHYESLAITSCFALYSLASTCIYLYFHTRKCGIFKGFFLVALFNFQGAAYGILTRLLFEATPSLYHIFEILSSPFFGLFSYLLSRSLAATCI